MTYSTLSDDEFFRELAGIRNRVFSSIEDLLRVEEEIGRLASSDPTQLRRMLSIAHSYEVLGMTVRARVCYLFVLRISPGNPRAEVGLYSTATEAARDGEEPLKSSPMESGSAGKGDLGRVLGVLARGLIEQSDQLARGALHELLQYARPMWTHVSHRQDLLELIQAAITTTGRRAAFELLLDEASSRSVADRPIVEEIRAAVRE